jgi:Magnesium chelatase, subunit ChlI
LWEFVKSVLRQGWAAIFGVRARPSIVWKWTAKLSEVHGQQHVKHVVKVAAAGAHNLTMIGPIYPREGYQGHFEQSLEISVQTLSFRAV